METVTLVGYLAALCSMTSFTPQAWKIIKTRDTEQHLGTDVRADCYRVCALWLIFGVLKSEWPIIITNGVCLILSAFIL